MAEDVANNFIKRHLDKFGPELSRILATDYRDKLDSQVAVLDVSAAGLSVSEPHDISSAYPTFYRLLKSRMKGSTFRSLENAVKVLGRDKLLVNPVFIDASTTSRFLVGDTRRHLRNLITEISKYPELSDSVFGTKEGSLKSKVNLVSVSDSPLEKKLADVLLYYKGSPELTQVVKNSLQELYSAKSELKFNYTSKTSTNVLGEGVLSLRLSSDSNTSELSKKAQAVYSKFLFQIATSIQAPSLPGAFGANVLDDITKNIVNSLSGKKPTANKDTSTKNTKTTKTKGSTSVGGTSGSNKLAPLRSLQGSFYSLTSLQALINTHLQDTISANMGSGGETRILNYRTGRFAASAQVERLSQSRAGAITAFYRYMRYPYQTFEPGFAQGSPRSRDPKLLISQSIREIAATKVSNALRAVSI